MNTTRRSFLAAAALGSVGLALPAPAASPSVPSKARVKLGISTYSYWHFRTAKVPIETVLDKSAALNVEGQIVWLDFGI